MLGARVIFVDDGIVRVPQLFVLLLEAPEHHASQRAVCQMRPGERARGNQIYSEALDRVYM